MGWSEDRKDSNPRLQSSGHKVLQYKRNTVSNFGPQLITNVKPWNCTKSFVKHGWCLSYRRLFNNCQIVVHMSYNWICWTVGPDHQQLQRSLLSSKHMKWEWGGDGKPRKHSKTSSQRRPLVKNGKLDSKPEKNLLICYLSSSFLIQIMLHNTLNISSTSLYSKKSKQIQNTRYNLACSYINQRCINKDTKKVTTQGLENWFRG